MTIRRAEKFHEWQMRVQYSETDQMRVAHHANYINWFEVARIEFLRELGWTYRAFEEQGFILPVLEAQVKYKRSAFYDDLLTVKTRLVGLKRLKMEFRYEIWRENEHLADGKIVLGCLPREGYRPAPIPDNFFEVISEWLVSPTK